MLDLMFTSTRAGDDAYEATDLCDAIVQEGFRAELGQEEGISIVRLEDAVLRLELDEEGAVTGALLQVAPMVDEQYAEQLGAALDGLGFEYLDDEPEAVELPDDDDDDFSEGEDDDEGDAFGDDEDDF